MAEEVVHWVGNRIWRVYDASSILLWGGTMRTRELLLATSGITLAALAAGTAHAETDCAWVERGSTRYLRADCQTDATLLIPDGFTLDGRGHTIKAHDPVDGAFEGAVVRNAGNSAHVRNLVIDAAGLAPVCHAATPADTRVRAILLQDADGSIVDNHVLAINQGASGCQEGSAIEVRASERNVEVLISANHVENFQKGGIVVIGTVDAGIYLNRVEGQGPTPNLAQNGIQLSGGATGSVKLNRVRLLRYAPGTATAAGILLLDAEAPLEVSLNHIDSCDVGIFLSGTSNAEIHGNSIGDSTYDGISIDGRSAPAEQNRVLGNYVARSAGVGIDLFGVGTRENVIKLNVIVDSGVANVQEVLEAGDNILQANGPAATRL